MNIRGHSYFLQLVELQTAKAAIFSWIFYLKNETFQGAKLCVSQQATALIDFTGTVQNSVICTTEKQRANGHTVTEVTEWKLLV